MTLTYGTICLSTSQDLILQTGDTWWKMVSEQMGQMKEHGE